MGSNILNGNEFPTTQPFFPPHYPQVVPANPAIWTTQVGPVYPHPAPSNMEGQPPSDMNSPQSLAWSAQQRHETWAHPVNAAPGYQMGSSLPGLYAAPEQRPRHMGAARFVVDEGTDVHDQSSLHQPDNRRRNAGKRLRKSNKLRQRRTGWITSCFAAATSG